LRLSTNISGFTLTKLSLASIDLDHAQVTHSLGGGTGSGVGTYLLSMLHDLYPKISKFSSCVYPSEDNDVVTSPYNTVLAMKELVDHADCVFPIDNSALFNLAKIEAAYENKVAAANSATSTSTSKDSAVVGKVGRTDKGFDAINAIAARMLCNLTSSSRFHGEMNVDLNEIYTNLVPFPKLHFLMTALNVRQPLSAKDRLHRDRAANAANHARMQTNASTRPSDASRIALQRCFNDLFSSRGQVTAGDPTEKGRVTLATAFLAGGDSSNLPLSDFLKCVTDSSHRHLRFPSWNEDACKVCSSPSYSLFISLFLSISFNLYFPLPLSLSLFIYHSHSLTLSTGKIGMCSTPSPGDDLSVLAVFNR
jgi:tubulin epsilon